MQSRLPGERYIRRKIEVFPIWAIDRETMRRQCLENGDIVKVLSKTSQYYESDPPLYVIREEHLSEGDLGEENVDWDLR